MGIIEHDKPFFKAGEFSCPIYCKTRDRTDAYNTAGREFMEAMWRECGAFLDPSTSDRATQSMASVFWELYLARTLKGCGISLQLQQRTKMSQKGPDLFASNPNVWIEAIVPGFGTGPDAMEYPPLGEVYDIPVDTFILRLRSAFAEKARKMDGYIKARLIEPTEATVIAISGAMLPNSIGEGPVPRIVQATLGVGNLVFDIDRRSRRPASVSVNHRDEIIKRSGAVVNTAPFLDRAYSHISAVVYSPSNWVTHSSPETLGDDFEVIHNENANVKLPHGWLPAGVEYWREYDELRRHDLRRTARKKSRTNAQ